MNDSSCEIKTARKSFSWVGLTLCVILALGTLLQILWQIWGEDNWLTTSSWGMWLGTFAPIYLIAIPVGLLMLRRIPKETPQGTKLGGKNFIVFLPIAFCLMYGGNLIGTLLSALFSGGVAENPLTDYAMDTNPLKIVVMVILAPLIEEYVFRKQIIDRTKKYGEKLAVFLSALTFGLFHLNLFQFFYAFGLGLIFAYIYVRTGRLRYSVIYHAIINFMGSVVAPLILTLVDLEALENMDVTASAEELLAVYGGMMPGLLVYLLYVVLLLGLAITGLVLLILKCKKLTWREATAQLPRGAGVKTAYLNVGMIIYILLCLSTIIISLL